ncbi:MAG: InlB B-repeat-containing protein, partial [Bacteroidales bacterium]|nr:InlB B-repeat-containing protein [Bacteroidales bacterium]
MDGRANSNDGYLFDWGIVFDESVLTPAGNSVDSAAVIIPNSNGQMDEQYFSYGNSDTTFIFNAPIVSHNTTITDTLRLFDPATGCWYDTVFQITVLAPEGTAHHDTICEGESITLTAECTSPETLIFSEGFSDITTGNDNNGSGSSTKYQCNLENFPNCDNEHVFNAGGHLRFGDVSSGGGGYITSKSIDLSNPYTIKLWARGWNNANENPFFYLKVDNDIVLQQSLPVSAWDAPYTQYNYPSPIGANSSSTITIGNSELHQRFFLDSVAVVSYAECQYSWSTGATTSEITDSPGSNTTYYVTITPPGGCATVDTFYVVVKPKPTVTFDPCGGTCATLSLPMECQNGVTLPEATPCASDYVFAGWSTAPVDPAVTTEPEPLYLNGEMFLSSQDITLYAVYMKCTPTGGSKYVKVSSDTSDWTGEYLIAYSEGNKVFDGSRSNLDSVNNFQPVTISNGVIAGSSQPFTFTINPRNNNKYSIKSANNFYIGNDANSNSLSSSTTTQYDNTISYDNGNIDIAGNNGAHLRFNDNNDQKRFRYFKSSTYTSQKAIQLYRNEPDLDCVWWSFPSCNPVITLSQDCQPDNHDWGCETPTAPTFTVTDDCNGSFQLQENNISVGDVQITSACGRSLTWTANYTDECGTQATPVSITYSWTVGVTPTISTELALEQNLGCELPTAPAVSDFTVADACAANPQVSLDNGVETTEGCTHTKVWTASYTGSCNLTAEPVTITRSWTVGVTPTISTELALEQNLGCELPTAPAVSDFTVTDDCAPNPQVSLDNGVETTEGCTHTKVWTASYTGSCNLTAEPVTITRSWTVGV